MIRQLPKDEFVLQRPVTWEEIYAEWEAGEGSQPPVKKLYTDRGFDTWREWRNAAVTESFNCAQRKWFLYQMPTPHHTVPRLYGGTFESWRTKWYQGELVRTFEWIVAQFPPEERAEYASLVERFPVPTTLIGIKFDEKIIIIEGMHRCCAIALAEREGKRITAQPYLALAETSGEEIPKLYTVRKPRTS